MKTPTKDKDVLVCEIIEAACSVTNTDEQDFINTKHQSAASIIARRACAHVIRESFPMSYPDVAEAMLLPRNSHPKIIDWCDKFRCCPCSQWVASEIRRRVGIEAAA